MEQIRLYLAKFKDWRPADADLKETLRDIIKRRWGVAVNNNNIRLSGFTVYLKIKPILRSEIMIHQEAIVKELEEKLGHKTPKKIV